MKNNELLQELYQCFSGKVETYIRSQVETPQDVEDMVSQVFLKVCQNIDSFSEEKAAHSTWIYAITHNVVIDLLRRKGGGESPMKLCGELPTAAGTGQKSGENFEGRVFGCACKCTGKPGRARA